MIKSAKHDPLHDLMNTAKDLMLTKRHAADHMCQFRRNASIGTGLTLLAVALGFAAVSFLKKAKSEGELHRAWSDQDQKLDEALDSTFDASDAVAKY